jgi:DNA mismatch repair protein MutL
MTRINILPPLVADMIAAGEVVERPASVIKELMENSFDAGAKKVTVEFKSGGATYIKISDDGCGMSPEDAGIAFTRHATSKLHDEKGLEAIGTMGFRGEALAAIAAVSRIELVTREKGSPEGVRVTVHAGDIVDMSPCGCPEGTTITVRDIFHNTPARLKFLKSDRSEASACIAAATHCALGRPEVSVRLKRDGEEVFFTPGDGREESAVYALLGRETARGMLPVSGKTDTMSVTGFTSSPAFGRGNRANQHFYCNGRYIKSVLLQAAVEQAYKNTLLTGKFPSCVLYLELSRGAVDVNVHPAKTEVKFSDEKKVFDLVYQTVRACLEAEQKPIEIRLSEGTKKAVSEPRSDFFRSMSADEYRAKASAPSPVPERRAAPVFKAPAAYSAPGPVSGFKPPEVPKAPASPKTDVFPPYSPPPARENVEKTVENVEKISTPACRVIGEALDTYIIAEIDDELMLIDKHAAHERMIFDRLKTQERQIMSQTLLAPVIIRPTAEDAEIMDKNAALLDEMGFEVEPFGQNSYAVRAVPDDVDVSEAASALEEICEKLRGGDNVSAAEARDEILHTVACKAAIKAGRKHDIAELERIACAVAAGEVKYCPHGRPVSARLTKKQLDKFFSRIV